MCACVCVYARVCVFSSVLHELFQVLHVVVLRHLDVVLRPIVGATPPPHRLTRHLDAEKREFIVAWVSHLFQKPAAGQRRAQPVAIRAARVPGVAVSVHRSVAEFVRAVPCNFLGPEADRWIN